MYEIIIDCKKNRLVFTLGGQPSLEECATISENLMAAYRQLSPGFSVITSVSTFYPRDLETRLIMENTMKMARGMGMKYVVRITPNPIVHHQCRFSSLTAGYEAILCANLEEAEQTLDQLEAGGDPGSSAGRRMAKRESPI